MPFWRDDEDPVVIWVRPRPMMDEDEDDDIQIITDDNPDGDLGGGDSQHGDGDPDGDHGGGGVLLVNAFDDDPDGDLGSGDSQHGDGDPDGDHGGGGVLLVPAFDDDEGLSNFFLLTILKCILMTGLKFRIWAVLLFLYTIFLLE